MSNHMIKNVAKGLYPLFEADCICNRCAIAKHDAHTAIQALKEYGPNSFIAEIINKYAGLNPMDEHGRKLWNSLIDAVLNMKEKA